MYIGQINQAQLDQAIPRVLQSPTHLQQQTQLLIPVSQYIPSQLGATIDTKPTT